MEKKPLIILTGPTAVGKTDISILLAKAINGEIISADSMQVYKYMDIGSAKVTQEEMCGIKHYLVDVINPDEEFNVVVFQRMAKEALEKIYNKGKIPIIVGGTGFYIQALLYDIDFDYDNEDEKQNSDIEKQNLNNSILDEEINKNKGFNIENNSIETELLGDKAKNKNQSLNTENNVLNNDTDRLDSNIDKLYRLELENLQREKGNDYLHNMLMKVDEKSAETIHPNNVKRVIRALEYYHKTGNKISVHNEQQRKKTSPYNFLYFVLTDDRQVLYEKINKRIDIMLEKGLVNEVQLLANKGYTRDMVSMQGLGYKEILDYLSGAYTYEEAVDIIKRDTRHFAKRQLTWFKRERNVIWIDKREFDEKSAIVDYIKKQILLASIDG